MIVSLFDAKAIALVSSLTVPTLYVVAARQTETIATAPNTDNAAYRIFVRFIVIHSF